MKIFFLPGWSGVTEDFAELSQSLGEGFSCECLYSAPISENFPEISTIEDFVSILALKLQKEKEPYALCGYSMGGRIASVLSSKLKEHNKNFRALILCSSGLGLDTDNERAVRSKSDEQWCAKLNEDKQGFWKSWYSQNLFKSIKELPSPKLDTWMNRRDLLNPRLLARDMDIFSQSRHEYLLPFLQDLLGTSILYLYGELDEKYAAVGVSLKRGISSASVLHIPGVGHVLPLEAPVEMAKLMKDWLDKVARS